VVDSLKVFMQICSLKIVVEIHTHDLECLRSYIDMALGRNYTIGA
jgi:hypothetical protein